MSPMNASGQCTGERQGNVQGAPGGLLSSLQELGRASWGSNFSAEPRGERSGIQTWDTGQGTRTRGVPRLTPEMKGQSWPWDTARGCVGSDLFTEWLGKWPAVFLSSLASILFLGTFGAMDTRSVMEGKTWLSSVCCGELEKRSLCRLQEEMNTKQYSDPLPLELCESKCAVAPDMQTGTRPPPRPQGILCSL